MSNFSIDSTYSNASTEISNYLYTKLLSIYKANKTIIFLCIGTDRSTGDSVGPLVGYKLQDLKFRNFYIYGSLINPIHSKNLVETLNQIYNNFTNPYIIAIDSCLGSINNVGKIFINDTPLRPGLALNKNLPEVGDMSITGIVNISGGFDFIILQNTRLYTVMNISDSIAKGIYDFIIRCHNTTNSISTKY